MTNSSSLFFDPNMMDASMCIVPEIPAVNTLMPSIAYSVPVGVASLFSLRQVFLFSVYLTEREALVHFCESTPTFSNTASNISYIIAAFFVPSSPPLSLPLKISMLMVGVGSYLFHSTSNFFTELLDELSMTLVLFVVFVSQRLILSGNSYDVIKIGAYVAVIIFGWVDYVLSQDYEVFKSFFTLLFSLTVIDYLTTSRTKSIYPFLSLLSFLLGRLTWQSERDAFEAEKCEGKEWLHPIWHALSAAGCVFWCKGLEEEWVIGVGHKLETVKALVYFF
ncbi:hypothetical protein TrVE_jg1734 [Triparma verrucosa]|uniref:Alkaline ceramidase n=1 Tax=Triparma verrucosa TaxID=1606542 RepID=A0A9W7BFL0_9STRA|nr:hypothetical protein TrVE_jg1734 [Triparma verrucosa]